MDAVRTIAEIAIGVLFGVGAVFNAVYTLRHHTEFYGSFAEGAWFPPARSLIRRWIIPNGTVFTLFLIVFQAALAIAILSRGDLTQAALFAGGVFCAGGRLVLEPGR